MKRVLVPILLLAFSAASIADEAADNGAKYIAGVSQAWAQGLPEDFTLGMYVGRKWIGKAVFSVKAAPAESGAAYEMSVNTEIDFGGQAMEETSRALLAKDLSVVSAHATSETAEGKEVKTLSTRDGKWTLHTEKGEEKKDTSGDLAPNATWDGMAFLAFARPETDKLAILSLSSDTPQEAISTKTEKETLWLDGKEAAYQALVIEGGDKTAHWYYAADGTSAAVKFEGAPFLARPCKAADAGKDLAGLPVPASGRVVASLYLAIKKNDGEGAAALFDIQTMAKEAGQSPADFEKDLLGSMMTEQVRSGLPEPELVEDLFAAQMTCTQEGDEGTAKLGPLTFRLHKTTDAAGDEAWLIYGLEQ